MSEQCAVGILTHGVAQLGPQAHVGQFRGLRREQVDREPTQEDEATATVDRLHPAGDERPQFGKVELLADDRGHRSPGCQGPLGRLGHRRPFGSGEGVAPPGGVGPVGRRPCRTRSDRPPHGHGHLPNAVAELHARVLLQAPRMPR